MTAEEQPYEIDAMPIEDEPEEGPLVERLRRLEWPAVEPELRQQSWARFQLLMADGQGGDAPDRG